LQMPGTIMAMGRLNRPSIMVYGGTIKVLDLTLAT
jgi:dihydroxy-acid dehydratase